MTLDESLPHSANTDATRILAVIVLYKKQPAESPTLDTLLEAMRRASDQPVSVSIVLADNTPGGQHPGALAPGIQYRAYATNPGLAKPYNDAISLAEHEGIPWLLTLDQDTHLPPDFLVKLRQHVDHFRAMPQVATIVPRIMDGARPVSPFRFAGGFLPRLVPAQVQGVLGSYASAINSAALHRTAALASIGGFDERFPLHNSDTRMFQKLDSAGKQIAVANDIIVQHEFSMLDRANRMSPERYRQNLLDECRFWDLQMSSLGRAERFFRLVLRAINGMLQRENAAVQAVTLQEIRRRLTTSRRSRLHAAE